jgi:Protein of unknown function (DUF1631)
VSSAAPLVDQGVVLAQCRAAAEKRLVNQLALIGERLAETVHAQALASGDRLERDRCLKTVERLRHQGHALLDAFRKEFAERVEERTRALQGIGLAPNGLDRQALSMVTTSVLEYEIAVEKLHARLKECARVELDLLARRLATLCRCPTPTSEQNPFGTLPIAHGIVAGLAELDVDVRMIRALGPMLEKHLAEPVRELLLMLDGLLDKLRIEPAAAPKPAPTTTTAGVTSAPVALAVPSKVKSPAAEAAAARAVATARAGASLPAAIERFLKETWLQLLARCYAAEGSQGSSWREAVQTMHELVWSLQPKGDSAERAHLVELLPGLLKRIVAGMDAVALEPDLRTAVLDELIAQHRKVLHTPRGTAPL